MLFLFQTAAFPFSLDSGEMVFFPHFGKGLLRLGASAVCCNSAVDFPLNSFGIFSVRLSFGTDIPPKIPDHSHYWRQQRK